MTQQLFASLTSPSLVNLDANFTECYNGLLPFTGYGGSTVLPGKTDTGVVTPGAYFEPTSINYGRLNLVKGSGSGSSGTVAIGLYYNGSQVGNITCTNTNTTYSTTSDQRLKTSIADMPDVGAVIEAMRPRTYSFIADPNKVVYGFVAQELNGAFPSAVQVGGDDPKLDPWSVDYSKLVPLLVRELQSLRLRVAALEAR